MDFEYRAIRLKVKKWIGVVLFWIIRRMEDYEDYSCINLCWLVYT